MKVNTIKNLNLKKGDNVLLRLDLNVPTIFISGKEKITNAYRINEAIPTILKLQKKGVKLVIIAHKETGNLKAIFDYLKKKVKKIYFKEIIIKTLFANKFNLDLKKELENIKNGEIILLDNLRLVEGEKKNDINFVKTLSDGIDYYINDAFSASHRKHASIIGIPQFLGKKKSAIGPNFENEIEKLQIGLKPVKPVLLILGGAKFETKLALLEKYIDIADKIFVGGALAHTFWKMRGYNIGKSLIDNDAGLSAKVIDAYKKSKIILPIDVITNRRKNITSDSVVSDERITDFGIATLEALTNLVKKCKTIIWNGPLGYYEGGFDWGTKELLKMLGKTKGKKVILGGGDTVAVAEKVIKVDKTLKFNHISTGGGAMIDYLSNGTLPGLEVLK